MCGLKSETKQRKLLTEPDLTFMRAVKVAQSDETSTAKAKLLQGHYSSPALSAQLEPHVYKMSRHGQQPQGKDNCYVL